MQASNAVRVDLDPQSQRVFDKGHMGRANPQLLTNALLEARRRNDLSAMIEQAGLLRHADPKAAAGYELASVALRQSGRLQEAATILDDAKTLFDDKAWLSAERIRLALQLNDWAGAAEQAATTRKRFSREVAGWRLGFTALGKLGRTQEALALLKSVPEHLAGEEWLLVGLTSLAVQRRAWNEVDELAVTLRRAFPNNELGYREGMRSLRRQRRFEEAGALLTHAEIHCAGKTWLLMEAATLAQGRGENLRAIGLWQQVRLAKPDHPSGYAGGLQSFIAAARTNDAEVLLREAEARFPSSAWLMAQSAEITQAQGRFQEAAELWATVRIAYPDKPEGYHGGYRMARKIGKLEDAEALLRTVLARSPGDRWALIESAVLAEARYDYGAVDRHWERASMMLPDDAEIALKYALARSVDRTLQNRDWPTTLDRLQKLNARLPEYVPGWQAHIKSLRLIGALAQADQLAKDCLGRLSNAPELWLEYALTAGDQSAASTERLAEAAERFPEHAQVQSEYGNALGRVGRLDEAETQYHRALARFPESANLLCGHAVIAMRQQDWPAALRRWQDVQARYPEDTRVATGLVDTYAALGNLGTAEIASPSGAAPKALSDRAEMFWQIESLGGTGQACEFGFVQRAGGAEPLGLLRWTYIEPKYLLEALLNRFEGVGTPQQTLVDYYIGEDPDNPEYRYNDLRLKMRMHTFIRKKDTPFEKMYEQTCRRMKYLRGKLIRDLEEAEKIFVYKIYERNLDDNEVRQLYQAMRGYGDNTLLYVRYADTEHPSGTVIHAGDGLLIGYISGFNISLTTHKLRPPDQPAWEAICRTALDLHRRVRSVF